MTIIRSLATFPTADEIQRFAVIRGARPRAPLAAHQARRWQRTKHAAGLMEIPDWAGDCARDTLAATGKAA